MQTKISLDALDVLDAIQRHGSFAAAASALHRVPSAITYTIQKLESDLGVSLFDRRGHRAVMTPAAEELLQQGRYLIQAAQELESRVKRVATGFEAELTIAVDDLIPIRSLYPLIKEFDQVASGTRIKLCSEVFGGTWDALLNGRADIGFGVAGEIPSGTMGISMKSIGNLPFVFSCAPSHPLAKITGPISNQQIQEFRAVAVADSSRNLPPRTANLLRGQDVLTVPNMLCKVQAQIDGLGVGYLPLPIASKYAATGELIIKNVIDQKHEGQLHLAWHTRHEGKAQAWFIKQLSKLNLADLIH